MNQLEFVFPGKLRVWTLINYADLIKRNQLRLAESGQVKSEFVIPTRVRIRLIITAIARFGNVVKNRVSVLKGHS